MKNHTVLKLVILAIGTFTAIAPASAQTPPPGLSAPDTTLAVPLTSEEIDELVAQIRANPGDLDTLVATAINRDPDAAPLIVERLITEFSTQIQGMTVAVLTAVQNSPAPAASKTTIIGSTALSAATAARDTEGEFVDQQVAVAAVTAAVQQVVPTAEQAPLLTTVQSVLTPPTPQNTNTPVTDTNNDDEDIDGSEQSPDQTTPTTL